MITYHTTKVESPSELRRILATIGSPTRLKEIWTWLPDDDEMVPFIMDTCHIYRIDDDLMDAVIGTRDPLALFMVSSGEFYVWHGSQTTIRSRMAVFETFCDHYDLPLRTYIPPKRKALIRLCKTYGFQPIGDDVYVKQ